jgi:outer membrane cobalamin receptor
MQAGKRHLTLILFLVTACAGPARAPDEAGGGDSNRLTQEQLAGAQVETVFDAVRRLRPNWLRQRAVNSLQGGNTAGAPISVGGSTPSSEVVVYVDGARVGGPEVLRSIPANAAEAVEYLDGASATSRFGTGNVAGAIVITTR